jgi:NAD(P)H-flavin reductase
MAIIKKYLSKVEKVKNPLPDIYTVSFLSDNRFQYNIGQFLHLALDEYDPSMQWPISRCFSMQSSPGEEHLTITFAVKGKFTSRMADELKPGKDIWLKLPYGDIFNRGHSLENCVFIAGGTGVTPFLSLFTDASFVTYKTPKLYLGFRSEKYDIFKEELALAKKTNINFEVIEVNQDKEGVLNIEQIYNSNPGAVYFISGPPIMIKNFKNYLLEKQMPEKLVITDDWE